MAADPTLGAIFLFFAKVGSILFGSGYVLLAFLRADLVDRWHWLTEAQLLDGIAVGQITASLALMAVVSVQIARAAIVDVRFKVSSVALIFAGAVVGIVATFVR